MVMMYRLKIILVLFMLSLLSSVGCSDKEKISEEIPVPELTVNPLTLEFSAEGGEKTLSIYSNTNWQINFLTSGWVRPSLTTSSGNVVVKVTADPNENRERRETTFTIKAAGVENVVVTITQAGKDSTGEPEEPEIYIEPDNTGMRNLSSLQLTQLMDVGWNLGNSLEAIVVNNGVYSGGETSWGNPLTTKTLIDSVKQAGFNCIRIPVAWSHKLEDPTTYKISKTWLARVEEVVNYALSNDMFVIINIHWDGGWMNHPDYGHQQAINNKLSSLWKQIAIYFRNYDDRLLFAGSNEVMVEGYYGSPSSENLAVQNSFNQTFVNAVRATGGRNYYRHLVVQGFNTNITYTYNGFILPSDVIEKRLMVEVHYYDPYEFTLKEDQPYNTQWGAPFAGGDITNWGQEDWVESAFGMMKTKFYDNGIPVILGEYAAIHRTSLTGEAYVKHKAAREYFLEYVTNAAKRKGLVPFYWDNGNKGNNSCVIFDRSTGEALDRGALEAIMKGKILN